MNIKYTDLLPIIKNPNSIVNALGNGASLTAKDSRGTWTLVNTTGMQLLFSHGLDKNSSTILRTATTGTINTYIEIIFPSEFSIGKYKLELGIQSSEYATMASWDILARVNGAWVTVHSGTNSVTTSKTYEYEFTPVIADRIRIKCTSKHGANSWGFRDFYLYEAIVEPINKTLILHDGEYKKFNAEVFPSDTVYSKGIVPVLTSNTSNGLAFSSPPADSAWGAYRAFSVDYNYWSAYAHSGNGYIGYLALNPMTFRSYSLAPSSNIPQMISKWRLYGSNNTTTGVDGDWEEIDYREYTNWASGQSVMFDLSKEVTYLAVKLTWESTVGNVANGINISRLDFHKVEKEAVKASKANWSTVSSTLPTQEQFLLDGMDSISPLLDRRVEKLEPLPMTLNNGFLSNGEVGKVFTKTIDLNKYLDIRSIREEMR